MSAPAAGLRGRPARTCVSTNREVVRRLLAAVPVMGQALARSGGVAGWGARYCGCSPESTRTRDCPV
jgi:hypothetical protein